MTYSTIGVWSLRIKLLLLTCLAAACTSTKPGSSSAGKAQFYQEDVSKWRPAILLQSEKSDLSRSNETTEVARVDVFLKNQSDAVDQVLDSVRQWNRRIKYIQGYRLLIYNGKDRDAANLAKGYVYTHFPQAPVWTEYKQPYFKVKIGNYIERIEAQSMLALIKKDYPQVILVPEQIKISELIP
jgi:hypothetical protein